MTLRALGVSRSWTSPSSCSPAAFHAAILQFHPRWSDPSPSEVRGPAAGEWANLLGPGRPRGVCVMPQAECGEEAVRAIPPAAQTEAGKGSPLSPGPLVLLPSSASPPLPWPVSTCLAFSLPFLLSPSPTPPPHPPTLPHLHGDKREVGWAVPCVLSHSIIGAFSGDTGAARGTNLPLPIAHKGPGKPLPQPGRPG